MTGSTDTADVPTAAGHAARARLLGLGGVTLALSGITGLVGGLLHPVVDGNAHSIASMTAPGGALAYGLLYGSAILLMIGLPAVIGWLAPRIGVPGVLGLGLYFLGNALVAQPHLVVEAFVARDLATTFPQVIPDDGSIVAAPSFALMMAGGGIVMLSGWLITGVALLRPSTGLPWWIGASFLAAVVLAFVPLPEMAVVSGLQIEFFEAIGCVGLGVLAVGAARGGRITDPEGVTRPVSATRG